MGEEIPITVLQGMSIDKGITYRIIRGFGANVYGQLVVIVIQLVGVPILLGAWGAQLYGEWLILAAIPTYLSMADLGFSQSAANDMTAQHARGDTAGMLAVFQSLSVLVYGLAIVGLIVTTLLAAFLPLGSWLHFNGLSGTDLRWVLWFLAAEVLVRLCDGVNHAGFRSHGEYARHAVLNASTMLMQSLCVWGAALLGLGPLGAAIAFFAVRAMETPMAAAWMLQRHRDIRLGWVHASTRELRRLFKPAMANLAMPMAQALNTQGMLLVVGTVMGPVAAVTFSVLRTLTRLVVQGIATVTHAMEPEVARAWGQGKHILVSTLYFRGLGVNLLLAMVVTGALYFLGGWILALWTHGKVVMHLALFHWLLLSAFSTVFWHVGINFLKALNLHVRAAIWFVLTSGLAVLMAELLLRWTHHLAVVGMALVLSDVLLGFYALLQMKRLLPRSQIA
jgi:O-antigen/teichoic acid export membrane protein